MKRTVTVPGGFTVSGRLPRHSAVVVREHAYRNELAELLDGITEVKLGYGRVDIIAASLVIEVKQCNAWRQAARQALQYSSQTGCEPAVALFGAAPASRVLDVYLSLRDGRPAIRLWWHDGDRWLAVTSRSACQNMGGRDAPWAGRSTPRQKREERANPALKAAAEKISAARSGLKEAMEAARLAVLAELAGGATEVEVARRLGVNRLTVRKWRGK